MAETQSSLRQDKYYVEKSTFGRVTHITMHGTLNEDFVGRKLAATLTNKVVIDMRDARRFASWGMTEWMDFLRVTSESDVYLVECSSYAASQLNIVTGLLGHAKLVSFYASYRCGQCGHDTDVLILVPRDRTAITDMPNRTLECASCGGRSKVDAYPAAFFEAVAARPAFDIDDDVLAFLRTHLKYDLSPDLTRFRAFRRTSRDFTYLRLSGNLATLPPEPLVQASSGTVLVDLEHVVAEPHQLDAWRSYVTTVAPTVKSLQLVHCPVGFLESALEPGDFSDKVKVRTFMHRYTCGTCGTWPTHAVDVAANLEELVAGQVPAMRCPTCRSTLPATVSPELASIVRVLPARDRDYALDAFLGKARALSIDDLENCTVARPPKVPAAARRTSLYIALGAVVLGIAIVALALTRRWNREPSAPAIAAPVQPPTPARPTFTRPDWILSDVPATATCQDLINRLMCVGVSTYSSNREDGVAEASSAALEQLASTVGLRISEPFFKNTIAPGYTDARGKALSDLQAVELQRTRDARGAAAFDAAATSVRKARKRVVDALKASGGAAVPVQWTDWYWEEYVKEVGSGHEFLVFVRYDVPLDAVRALVEKYSTTSSVLGSTVMTAFPELAWRREHFVSGAILTKVGSRLSAAGLEPQRIVVGVDDQRVNDAAELVTRIERAHGEVKLTVARDQPPDQVVVVKP